MSSWWLPTVAAGLTTIFGVVALTAQPASPGKRYWLAALLVVGGIATAFCAWQQSVGRGALKRQSAASAAQIAARDATIKGLEDRLRALQQKARHRTIEPAVAAKLADELRKAGNHRVVVSCAAKDVEAYDYANQVANVLRQAGWEALGPEETTIFGDAPEMGLRLYVRSGGAAPPEAAKLLIDAFTRLNIPFESGITPSAAIPDPATTEIFVSHKP